MELKTNAYIGCTLQVFKQKQSPKWGIPAWKKQPETFFTLKEPHRCQTYTACCPNGENEGEKG
jgi:hypothetical protein